MDRATIKEAEDINIDFKENFVKKLRNLTVCTDEERNSLSKEFGTRWRFDATFEGNAREITEYFSKYAKNDLNSGRFKLIQFSSYSNRITMDAYIPSQNCLVFSEIIKIGQDNYRYWHGIFLG